MRLLIFLLSFGQFSPHQSDFNIVNVVKTTIHDTERIPEMIMRDARISWRRVFRPIVLFGKKWTYWIAVSAAIGVLARLILFRSSYQDMDDRIIYSLIGILLLSLFTIFVLLLIAPLVWLFRLLSQITYLSPRRFSKCT